MFSQTDNSHQRYNEIWQPHRSLANFFTSNNEPSTANILKLLRMLRQHEYDLSFSLSRDPDMLAAMDWAAYLQDIDRSRHFSQLFVRNAPIVVPGPNKGEIFSALCRAFIG
jgi:hypothetical protein